MIIAVESTETGLGTRRIYSVIDFAQRHRLALGGIRALVFKAKQNGFHKAIRRIGRRVYLDEAAFFEWLDSKCPGEESR